MTDRALQLAEEAAELAKWCDCNIQVAPDTFWQSQLGKISRCLAALSQGAPEGRAVASPGKEAAPVAWIGAYWFKKLATETFVHVSGMKVADNDIPFYTAPVTQATQPQEQPRQPGLKEQLDALGIDSRHVNGPMRAVAAQASDVADTMPRAAWEQKQTDLLAARKLVCDLWTSFPEVRDAIEGRTGAWFAWGVDRDTGYLGRSFATQPASDATARTESAPATAEPAQPKSPFRAMWDGAPIADDQESAAQAQRLPDKLSAEARPAPISEDLSELHRKGAKAWADVSSATGFVEELRGNAPISEAPKAAEPPNAWRDHNAAIEAKALATATEISLMWGQDRSQFVSRIQAAVREAIDWVRFARWGDNPPSINRAVASASQRDSLTDEQAALAKFYGVETLAEIVATQARSIERLQKRLAKAEKPIQWAPINPRSGGA